MNTLILNIDQDHTEFFYTGTIQPGIDTPEFELSGKLNQVAIDIEILNHKDFSNLTFVVNTEKSNITINTGLEKKLKITNFVLRDDMYLNLSRLNELSAYLKIIHNCITGQTTAEIFLSNE